MRIAILTIISVTLSNSLSAYRNSNRKLNMSAFKGEGNLEKLCGVSKRGCDALQPMVKEFYNAISGETAKLKGDKSVFTIADGVVQFMLINYLFGGDKFAGIVGEEEGSKINIDTRPYTVDDLTVPEQFYDLVDGVKNQVIELSKEIDSTSYKELSVFIDPIDGTREFSTGLGEQCSICIGFSDSAGLPVAGIVYRPITEPPTFATGAKSENFVSSQLDRPVMLNPKGFLTSNGKISKFIESAMEELGFERVPSGGAGNKMLMLLEGKGAAYIQDRGVSRWDTCGAQAVIEAHGGSLSKLTTFMKGPSNPPVLSSYTYLKSDKNLDFEGGVANLTPYNAANKSLIKKDDPPRAGSLEEFQPYSNLCGLLALDAQHSQLMSLGQIYSALSAAKDKNPPSFD